MNWLGGNRGVDIHGVVGTEGLIVTPIFSGMYEKLAQGARIAVSGRTIIDFVLKASSSVPSLQAALSVAPVARAFAEVARGTPFGWAVAAGVGIVIDLLAAEPNPDEHGGIHADRDRVGSWETFTLAYMNSTHAVSLLSHMGTFSARDGGGGPVYANRPWVREWETWTLLHNPDGTVSLRSWNGHFFVAEDGGGRECWANRTAIGDWEKFHLENLPGGQIALKTVVKGKYVSVQHGV